MNRNLPSRAQSLLCRQTRIVQPALIEEICGAVWTSGPCQCRDGVDYKANVLYISRFFEAMLHKDAIARIIDPYCGPIGPKLRCSCRFAKGTHTNKRVQWGASTDSSLLGRVNHRLTSFFSFLPSRLVGFVIQLNKQLSPTTFQLPNV